MFIRLNDKRGTIIDAGMIRRAYKYEYPTAININDEVYYYEDEETRDQDYDRIWEMLDKLEDILNNG